MIRTNLNKCRIIFFDLEFYVPKKNRKEIGLSYNPWEEDSLLLGGTFLEMNPKKDNLNKYNKTLKNEVKNMWLWNYETERKLIIDIYRYLVDIVKLVEKAHKGTKSAILCGIGISASDIPIIFELFKRYKILNGKDSFRFLNKFRFIDISQLAIPLYNNKTNFLYPKSKNDMIKRFNIGSIFKSGTSVWDLYESNNLEQIIDRTENEIILTYKLYCKIVFQGREYKRLEQNNNKRIKRDKYDYFLSISWSLSNHNNNLLKFVQKKFI